ncbi:MAG: hypothetical protein SVY10_18985 [Thermodesulfobacteriota bacterium]|nr:hypothetical protein [Thermodesulfobacteriota bacterium]
MGLRERIASAVFGGEIDRIVEERITAATVSIGREEDQGWTRLTGQPDRQLPDVTQERMIEICYWLWKTNPLANWIIEITKDFVVGEGLPFEAENDNVKEVLEGFWNDPINAMDISLEKFVRELGIYGEQCWPVYTAEQTGRIRLGYIDPARIKKVETDPENCKMVIGVILKGQTGEDGKKYGIVLPRDAEDLLSNEAKALRKGYSAGECFFFSINNVTNAPRGTSDLFVIADWLDAYEQFLFDYADKWPLLNTFVWDLLVKGGDSAKLDEELRRFTKKAGSVYAHNEGVELNEITPDLKSVDAETGARLLRNHILGSKSLPEHWFGGGGDVNRATALEMGAPAFKTLSSRQKTVKYILERVCDCVIEKALEARYLTVPEDEAYGYSINVPEMATRDITKFASAIQQLASSLMIAENQGWIDKDTATVSFIFGLRYLGLELDVEAVGEKKKGEKGREGYEDY